MNTKYLIILLLFILMGCEDILFEEEDNSYIIIDTEQEKVDLLDGIYAYLVRVHGSSYLETLSRSDDINIYNNYSFYYPEQTEGNVACNASNGSIDRIDIPEGIYHYLYYAILNTNNLISQLDEAEDALVVGESYFLRAYCYFKLARLFGTPPLVDDIDVDYLIEKPTYRQVFEFIEGDLLKALELLPDHVNETRIPRETPHKGTVKALLAEVYLSMAGFPVQDESKYALAAQYAGEVIDQADYYNFRLLEDMADLWKNDNPHHDENIFGLFFSGKDEETSNFFAANYPYIVSDQLFELEGVYKPEFKFFNEFPNNYRKWVSVVTGRYEQQIYDTLGGSEESIVFRPFDPTRNACGYLDAAVPLKWLDVGIIGLTGPYYGSMSGTNTGPSRKVTLCLIRYAHTLLTYAEAKARAGALDASCYEAVNMIRRRANRTDLYSPSEFDLPEGLSTAQFLDSLVWERAWELFAEPDGRWFDIIRLDLRDKLSEYRYAIDIPMQADPEAITEDWYFFKIPQHDRWLNPNYSDEEDAQ